MTLSEKYEKFKAKAGKGPFDVPDNPILPELVQMRLSEEEALFLGTFPLLPHSMAQLADRYHMDEAKLAETMAPLLKKGFIFEAEGSRGVGYRLTDPLFHFGRLPGWRGVDDEENRKYAPLMNRYYEESFGREMVGYKTKGLRAVPIAGTVKDPRTILPYEDVLAYVDREDYHTVSTCGCRHYFNLDPERDNCPHETEVCLHFGRLGKYIVKHGMGRKIEKAETLDILARCADAGLIHAMSNTRRGMDTICNCCACCCLFIRPIKQDPGIRREFHQRSNYYVQVNRDTCIACGKCEERCPIDAIRLVDKKDVPEAETGTKLKPRDKKQVAYDPERCIGCGVCVHKCPTDSLVLIKRDTVEDIPESMLDAGMRMFAERGKDPDMMFT